MGQGIAGIIPIVFRIKERNKEYLSQNYLDNFRLTKNDSQFFYYEIKEDILMMNFKKFLLEFNELIYTDKATHKWEYVNEFINRYDSVTDITTFEAFKEILKNPKGSIIPFYWDSRGTASVLGINEVYECIVFYSGSYKAFLEEYSTLLHMEKLLAKAIDNPLSTVTKFCIFG